MNKKVKGVVIFGSGLLVGTIFGSGIVVKRVFDDDDFRKVIGMKLTDKIDEFLFGEEATHQHSRSGYVSYRKYAEEKID